MKYGRNPENRLESALYVFLWVAGIAVSGKIWGAPAAALAASWGFFFILLHFIFIWRHYRRISKLTEEVSRFLHGYEEIEISVQKEGELSILENEIQKLILRLKNQAALLKEDKRYLADSLADISHQIRTPLTAVNLVVSRLSAPELSEASKKALLMELEGLLRHMEWLIQSLLKISRLDAGTVTFAKKEVKVRELVSEVAAELEISMELRNQKLEILAGEEVSYTGDFSWMKEAVSNIVKNCTEHTPSGGTIWIEAEENALYTEIVIRDNGPGIAREDLPYLFQRFYKGKNSSEKSVGIGLALARMIVTGQKGSLIAENDKAGGARFVLRFYKSVV
ncbi:MAG: HAMP domain-containing histidine kinase [Lachnospiraceae bacterium]|nr:HAMP domain-containing histidine kinase [Lachnospiraceae bacterium]